MAREEAEEEEGESGEEHFSTEVATHIKARQRATETERGREVGGDVTFHLATVATLDACGKLPFCAPFDARHARTRACRC